MECVVDTGQPAIIIAIIFEFAGAVLAGGEVTATIRKGILDASLFTNEPHLLIYGMLETQCYPPRLAIQPNSSQFCQLYPKQPHQRPHLLHQTQQ
jgi:hypothetical protein